jgi:hypothetical protein
MVPVQKERWAVTWFGPPAKAATNGVLSMWKNASLSETQAISMQIRPAEYTIRVAVA